MIQFHPARSYEDFVVGLYPRVAAGGLALRFVRATAPCERAANAEPHVLIIDEINRADLGRVLGEAVSLFEPGEPDRKVRLPHVPQGFPESLQLSPNLYVLGTRNTADRSIARIDLAIRRRFAFVDVWPSLDVVRAEGDQLSIELFEASSRHSQSSPTTTHSASPGPRVLLGPKARSATCRQVGTDSSPTRARTSPSPSRLRGRAIAWPGITGSRWSRRPSRGPIQES